MNARQLKVERTGDFAQGKIKPSIRLKGNWLERAGFLPNTNCRVIILGNGRLELHAATNAVPALAV
jgi:hypothetical protein